MNTPDESGACDSHACATVAGMMQSAPPMAQAKAPFEALVPNDSNIQQNFQMIARKL